jgi:hypothetical protein
MSILFLVLGVALSVVVWEEVSLPPMIGLLALGFGSGMAAGAWYAGRRPQASAQSLGGRAAVEPVEPNSIRAGPFHRHAGQPVRAVDGCELRG